MADIIDRRAGGGGGNQGQMALYKDVVGGAWRAETVAGYNYGWDTTDLAWYKLPVNHATGALEVHIIAGASSTITIADGADLAEGATTDAAVVTDTTGTVSGKLRGLVKMQAERTPASLGQKAMTASLPVVLASDQASIPTAATLAAETTKVIGTVNVAVAQTIAVTNAGTFAVTQATAANLNNTPSQATAANLNAQVVGALAAAAANAGNPVKIGGVIDSTMSVQTTGNIGDLKMSTRGYLYTTIGDGAGTFSAAKVAVPADALSNSTNFLFTHGAGLDFDGTTWNRHRGNEEVTLLASGARTTTQTSADIVNYNGLGGLIVVLDMTVVGTGSVTVTINGKDTASGKYRLLLSGVAITTNITSTYQLGPVMAAVANSVALTYLPRIIQIVVTANNANSATYSVGYAFVGR